MEWEKLEPKVEKYYEKEDGTHCINIIKTGFHNEYFVVHDDACGQGHGELETMTKEEIESKYGIKLSI